MTDLRKAFGLPPETRSAEELDAAEREEDNCEQAYMQGMLAEQKVIDSYKIKIPAAYHNLHHEWGWSFLSAPEHQLYSSEVIIVGLNPARVRNDSRECYGCHWDVPEGNVYFDKSWGGGAGFTALQKELHRWHDLLELNPTQTIGANFVPFRSKSWRDLKNPQASVEFSINLWNDVTSIAPASIYITMGKVAAWYLARILAAKLCDRLPTGWGSQSIDVYDSPDYRRIIAMPHPSRYRILNRGEASLTAEESFLIACKK